MNKLSKDQEAIFSYMERIVPEKGFLRTNFKDPKQYEFAVLMEALCGDSQQYPGCSKILDLIKADHEHNGFIEESSLDENAWKDLFTIDALGLETQTNTISSKAVATVVGGYSMISLSLVVKSNVNNQILARGKGVDFKNTLLTLETKNPGESADTDVTAYLSGTYIPQGSHTPKPIVAILVNPNAKTADPEITAPIRISEHPINKDAINIGLGRPWYDQGKDAPFDYAWSEPIKADPVGKIPFVGHVTFNSAIQAPLTHNLTLDIWVADESGGGYAPLDPTNLAIIEKAFSIDSKNPKTLKWNLPPGSSSHQPGNPIVFGSVPWGSDVMAYFYCNILVVLESGDIGTATVMSTNTADDDPSDGILQIKPISFIWHCIGEGAMVSMADGSAKPIEFVVAGDIVASETGKSEVMWTNKGFHKGGITYVQTDQGRHVIATDNHVFITDSGAKQAKELRVGDGVVTQAGMASIIRIEQGVDHDGMMYNLATRNYQAANEHDGDIATFYANDFLVGDINAQQALVYQRRNDIESVKAGVPAYLHQDVESFFADK